jgi:putative ABC transport system permease protein
VIISRAMERVYFNGRDAVGQFLRMKVSNHEFRAEVVGVAADVKHLELNEAPRAAIYQPHAQLPWPFIAVAIRFDQDPSSMAGAVRKAFAEVDSGTPVDRLQPMSALLESHLAQKRLAMTLLGIFASLALVLSSIGLYGVISISVSQRTREFGVRSALGATSGQILGLVFRNGLALVGLGLGIGLSLSPLATRTMKTMLYGVKPLDWATFAFVGGILAAVSAAAILIPALRASRVHPSEALRDS